MRIAGTVSLALGMMLFGIHGTGSAGTAHASRVAVLDNGTYVDSGNECGSESDNVQASLASRGHSLSTFTDVSATGLSSALSGRDVLLVPEQEQGDLAPALNEDARNVIRDFVAGGRRLVVHGYGGEATRPASDLIDALLGTTLQENDDSDGPFSLTDAGSQSSFAGGPPSIPDNNGTSTLVTGSLPAGATSVYEDAAGRSAVAILPYGRGDVIFLGWDWYHSNPPNSGTCIDRSIGGGGPGQDGGWQTVLDLAASVGACGRLQIGTTGNDTLNGTEFGDQLKGRKGNDRLRGFGGDDCLRGGKGNDRLRGGDGENVYRGGGGDDRINAKNSIAEKVRCGSGDDRARIDGDDTAVGCETVRHASH